jgi:hypothetical protein
LFDSSYGNTKNKLDRTMLDTSNQQNFQRLVFKAVKRTRLKSDQRSKDRPKSKLARK